MKKELLLGWVILTALSAFSQTAKTRPATGVGITAIVISDRLSMEAYDRETEPSLSEVAISSEIADDLPAASRTASYVSSWNVISSSTSPFSVTESASRPLQYNEDLNAVTFIHRKSPTYIASPLPSQAAESGVITAMVTQDWGMSWDSTCLWNDNANWGRYPQGALLAPAGSTSMYSAKLIGSTAVTSQNNNWTGNGFFVKQMGQTNYTNAAPATATFFPVLSPVLGKADFTIFDFQATDDGKVVALGYVDNDPNGLTTFGYRGARVVKGSFVSGNMIFTADSIIPNVLSTSAGAKIVIARPRMAWSEDGQVGYVIQLGAALTATLNNRGYQPIIYRTGNGGVSWSQVSGIDFNSPTMTVVTNMLLSTNSNTNVTIPYFNLNEGLGVTVDQDNKLHIACTLLATSSADPDSLNFVFSFLNADGESYRYRHTPGFRPYVYDFTGDGLPNSPWRVTLIDSLSSERSGTNLATSPDGFWTNPWNADADGTKIEVQSRIQCSRTADEKYIIYTWAESDTLFTTNSFKWNELPNIKARLMDVTTGLINPLEINVTKPGNYPFIINNNNVSSRAYLHYASPKCVLAQTIAVGPAGPAIVLPLTSSRPYGIPLSQTTRVMHRYMSALLNFGGISQTDVVFPNMTQITDPPPPPPPPPNGDSVLALSNEPILNGNNDVLIYPNPAKNNTTLFLYLKNNSALEIKLTSAIGQVVKEFVVSGQAGKNNVVIDTGSLLKGIYLVNIKIDGTAVTKKLLIE